jgi:multimeric flavodoxin WrbA
VAEELKNAGVETNLIWVDNKPVSGCIACCSCKESDSGRCITAGDGVNAALALAEKADGFVFGSPVHYASTGGTVASFLDRMFFAGKGEYFAHKPGAAVVSCRRSGGSAAVDRLNKYFTISQMPVVSSYYWNVVHGNKPEELLQDLEGVAILRTLGRNMAYMLRCIEAGRAAGINPPESAPRVRTNFIR